MTSNTASEEIIFQSLIEEMKERARAVYDSVVTRSKPRFRDQLLKRACAAVARLVREGLPVRIRPISHVGTYVFSDAPTLPDNA